MTKATGKVIQTVDESPKIATATPNAATAKITSRPRLPSPGEQRDRYRAEPAIRRPTIPSSQPSPPSGRSQHIAGDGRGHRGVAHAQRDRDDVNREQAPDYGVRQM